METMDLDVEFQCSSVFRRQQYQAILARVPSGAFLLKMREMGDPTELAYCSHSYVRITKLGTREDKNRRTA